MKEAMNNSEKRKQLLKHTILQLHRGQAPDVVRKQLQQLLGSIPYDEVVQVEQELISEGLPTEEVLKLCDVHTAVLKGVIDQSGAREPLPGHPVHTFRQENNALQQEIDAVEKYFARQEGQSVDEIKKHFNALSDVEKHYRRKENLLFPFLEKHGITGPPTVMWGKHDEVRELLKAAYEVLSQSHTVSADEFKTASEMVLKPATQAIEDMIYKEEHILFPMSLDTLTENEWYEIYSQSTEIGYCLFDPVAEWQPQGVELKGTAVAVEGKIHLPSGSFSVQELNAILNALPVDLTFVDKDDTVRYFTQGLERIFVRSRAILGRKVQQCHPPASVHIVQQILDDFRSGRQDSAAFWINMQGKFIHIEYFAIRDEGKNYLGALEVSQDLSEKRTLDGEQRILNYQSGK